MTVDNPEHDVYNIGKENEQIIKKVAYEVLDLTNTEPDIVYEPLPEDDTSQRRPDITRAKEELKWEPEIPLRHGLERTIVYFESTVL